MKHFSLTIGLLLLAACSPKVVKQPFPRPPEPPVSSAASTSSASVSSAKAAPEKTEFVYDNKKALAINQQLYDCLNVDYPDQATAEGLKGYVQHCDDDYWSAIKVKDHPPTFYAATRQGKGPDPFEEFVLCEHGLVSPTYDLPENYSPGKFEQQIQTCLALFPEKR